MHQNAFSIVVVGITILSATATVRDAVAKDIVPDNTESIVDSTISLQEVTVRAHFAEQNNTPLNLTTITPADIQMHQSAPNYLEMLQGIPGVYATASTGSYGDATLNMRGFKQDNISIMLNGIPIQGLTSGSMYWNNWMGLADATYAVQVQKGLGASMLADCAMGGMVNIVTKTAKDTPNADVALSATQYGTYKVSVGYSSGLLRHGWSIAANLSMVMGSGYVECSNVKTFSYMLSLSKALNDANTLIFTMLGSPEQHDQRNTELTAAEVETHGRNYSRNWGYLDGREYSIGRNHYFKPYFTLQHIMDAERLKMKNSVYLAIADGGGRSTYGTGKKGIIDYQTADGHIDFNAILDENASDGISRNIIIDYLSGHKQAGAICSADYHMAEAWTLGAGLQYQYYDTWSKMEVLNLLGGSRFQLYGKDYLTGDLIGSAYGRTTHHISGYVQTKYTTDHISANIGFSAFNGNYRRHDDISSNKSEWAHGWGASLKGGILWHISAAHAAYINAGYNSRLPYASTYLASSNLSVTNDIVNEKNIMLEAGYRTQWGSGSMELSGYLASWKDKTLSVSLTNRADEQKENYLVKGLDALHMGVELSVRQQITSWLKAKAYAMTASWKWKSAGTATIYDKYTNEELSTFTAYCDGLHVGDAPQSQIGAQIEARLPHGFYAHAAWQFNARMYADFEPSKRTDATDTADSYRLPSYSIVDATAGWEGVVAHVGGCHHAQNQTNKDIRMNVFLTATNLFNASYIERGTDGSTHDISSFKGYWGAARTVSLNMRMKF